MKTPASPQPGGNYPLKALEAALAIAPSAGFVARVRERVRLEPMGWPVWPRVRLALAGSLCLALLVVLGWIWSGRIPTGRFGGAERSSARAGVDALSRDQADRHREVAGTRPPAAPSLRTPLVVAPASTGPGLPRRSAAPAPAASPRADVAALDVIVPDDQRLALNRLLFAMRQGRATVPAPPRRLADDDGNALGPTPIDIPLLKPIELLPITVALDLSGSPEK